MSQRCAVHGVFLNADGSCFPCTIPSPTLPGTETLGAGAARVSDDEIADRAIELMARDRDDDEGWPPNEPPACSPRSAMPVDASPPHKP